MVGWSVNSTLTVVSICDSEWVQCNAVLVTVNLWLHANALVLYVRYSPLCIYRFLVSLLCLILSWTYRPVACRCFCICKAMHAESQDFIFFLRILTTELHHSVDAYFGSLVCCGMLLLLMKLYGALPRCLLASSIFTHFFLLKNNFTNHLVKKTKQIYFYVLRGRKGERWKNLPYEIVLPLET